MSDKNLKLQSLIISISVLITLTVALLFVFFIRYNSCMDELNKEKTITKQEQKTKLPLPPEERYFSGIIKSVHEESFIVSLKNGKQEEVFFNEKTEVLKGEGKGIIVSKEEIQPDYHVACFLPKDKNNNTALKVHMTSKYYEKNRQ
jgi:hypothetical protein